MSTGMLLFLFLALLTRVGHGSIGPEEQKPKSIFLLAGQSNMAGRGGVRNDTKTGLRKWDGIVPHESSPNPNILQLGLNKMWVQAHEPLHIEVDQGKTCGIGLGMPFADAILAKDPSFGVIGLVPTSKGGTKIEEWVRGTNYYTRLVEMAKASVQSGGKIQALLWYQGESDTKQGTDALFYKKRLEKFFKDVRCDLNSPNLPIILVAIGSAEGEYMNIVRNAQQNLNLDNVKCVDAMGLKFRKDNLHLSTQSEVYLGQKMADTFLSSFDHQS